MLPLLTCTIPFSHPAMILLAACLPACVLRGLFRCRPACLPAIWLAWYGVPSLPDLLVCFHALLPAFCLHACPSPCWSACAAHTTCLPGFPACLFACQAVASGGVQTRKKVNSRSSPRDWPGHNGACAELRATHLSASPCQLNLEPKWLWVYGWMLQNWLHTND